MPNTIRKRVKSLLRRSPRLLGAAYALRDVPADLRSFFPMLDAKRDGTANAFHGDRMWRQLVGTFIKELPISAIIETGTFLGDTASFLSDIYPGTIYTVELKGRYFRESSRRLKDKKNVRMLRGSSPVELARLARDGTTGTLPLFFLDAHWYDYWPLAAELAVLGRLTKGIVLIDDFKVPGRHDFGFDRQETADGPVDSDIEHILPALSPQNTYRFLFPNYRITDAFPAATAATKARGHIVIFQNASEEFDALLKHSAMADTYREHAR